MTLGRYVSPSKCSDPSVHAPVVNGLIQAQHNEVRLERASVALFRLGGKVPQLEREHLAKLLELVAWRRVDRVLFFWWCSLLIVRIRVHGRGNDSV